MYRLYARSTNNIKVLFCEIPSLKGNFKPPCRLCSTIKNYKPPKEYKMKVEYPERRKLRFLEKAPQPVSGQRMPKMVKNLIEMRGPELVHNKLIYKQFGIRAIQGGRLHYGHIEMMRLTITRKMDETKMFAVWRIDAPWKPLTKKGQGHRMGGGKGSIDHYVTPVKPDRIILEMGGECEYTEVYPLLKRIAAKLPFAAEPVTHELLQEYEDEQREMDERNINPFTFEYCLKNNMMGCRKWASPYDYLWLGKYR